MDKNIKFLTLLSLITPLISASSGTYLVTFSKNSYEKAKKHPYIISVAVVGCVVIGGGYKFYKYQQAKKNQQIVAQLKEEAEPKLNENENTKNSSFPQSIK